MRATRLVRRSIILNIQSYGRRRFTGVPQQGGSNNTQRKSAYLNYRWWKRRQAQKDKYYTSKLEDYEEAAAAMDSIKDENPIDESQMEMPSFNYNLEKEGFTSMPENLGYIPKSLDPMERTAQSSERNNNAKIAMFLLGAIPIITIFIYFNK